MAQQRDLWAEFNQQWMLRIGVSYFVAKMYVYQRNIALEIWSKLSN